MQDTRVCAVVVCWHPDLSILSSVLAAVSPQVTKVLLFANDGMRPALELPDNITVLLSETNVGLGAAYNRAADWAIAENANYLLLLDQDSVPEFGLVLALAATIHEHKSVAAAGSLWRDRSTGQDGFFIRMTRWRTSKIRPDPGSAPVYVDFLISSGSLISLDAFSRVGRFDEMLFIEHVDTDWCFRARKKGYLLMGVATARLDHSFGQAPPFRWKIGSSRRPSIQDPYRNYYLVRNSIILWRRPYVPRQWIIYDIRRTILLIIYYTLFVTPRSERLKCIHHAIMDAIKFDREFQHRGRGMSRSMLK